MQTLIVTSDITYVPRNHLDFFAELFARVPRQLAGLVVLRGLSFGLLQTIAGLYWCGARGTARTLLQNIADLPRGRRESLFERHGLPVVRARSMNEPWVADWVTAHRIDLIVNVRTRCVYQRSILSAPRLGCINIHHGILPRYRGVLCDLYALVEGRPAGFSIHRMMPKIDAGPILARCEVSSGVESSYVDYLNRTGRQEGRALADLLGEVDKTGQLPAGLPNRCPDPVYTSQPDWRTLRNLCRMAVAL